MEKNDSNGDIFFYLRQTNQAEIEHYFKSVKSYASGIDDETVEILKHVSHIISIPLLHIFNPSLSTVIFPDTLKKADIKDYSPISLLPAE